MGHYDIIIVGGGLGGLSFGILMARKGYSVAVIEKKTYPYHKVCGEYISNESYEFLQHLGMKPVIARASKIDKLAITTIAGKRLESTLQQGGIGISRYTLDSAMSDVAKEAGCNIIDGTKVNNIEYKEDVFEVTSDRQISFTAKLVVGAFGKKAGIAIKNKRFETRPNINYIGVKHHVMLSDFPEGAIELHNFDNGYCGMSAIEDGKHCLCYLANSKMLQQTGSIEELEKTVLRRNKWLSERLDNAVFLFEKPVTVSNIDFRVKEPVQNHLIMLGDAAGTIAPLCGNGMSMSMHAAYLLANTVSSYLEGDISRQELETGYNRAWKEKFKNRVKYGRLLQNLFGQTSLTEGAVSVLSKAPGITRKLIKLTHGRNFYQCI